MYIILQNQYYAIDFGVTYLTLKGLHLNIVAKMHQPIWIMSNKYDLSGGLRIVVMKKKKNGLSV